MPEHKEEYPNSLEAVLARHSTGVVAAYGQARGRAPGLEEVERFVPNGDYHAEVLGLVENEEGTMVVEGERLGDNSREWFSNFYRHTRPTTGAESCIRLSNSLQSTREQGG